MSRFQKILSKLGLVMAWIVVLFVVWFMMDRVGDRRDEMVVESLHINIADSTEMGNLITTRMVRQTLEREKIKSVGSLVKELPLNRIEKILESNGFVQSVRAYTNYSGELHIEIYQRSAVARILLDGYNCYISSEGYIFGAPPHTSLYVPVVTGSYKPIFPKSYVGNIDDYTAAEIEKLELEIEKIERERYPIFYRERKNNDDKRAVRRRYINKSIFEDQDEFDRKVVALREENQRLRNLYTYRQRVIDKELAAIDKKQNAVRERQKKLQKNCDDIHNLITFVEMIEDDEFWRSEVVQIELNRGSDGGMVISMAMRSGDFKVHFGALLSRQDYHIPPTGELDRNETTMRGLLPSSTTSKRVRAQSAKKERKRQLAIVEETIERRMERLMEFYRAALPRVGWDRYSEINIEFENQVVCKK